MQLQPTGVFLAEIADLGPRSILEKRAPAAQSRACDLCKRRDSKVQDELALPLQLRHPPTSSLHCRFIDTSCCTSLSPCTLLRAAWGLCLQCACSPACGC